MCQYIFIYAFFYISSSPLLYQGNVQDELAARLVRNRGPITAKITASGTTRRAASGEDAVRSFSLVAWKFAGDDGLVRGIMEEQIVDDDGDDEDEDRVDGEGGVDRRRRRRGLTVDVDCMARDGRVAVVGGTVRGGGGGSPSPGGGPTPRRRAYVRVGDGGDGGGDYISGVLLDVDLDLDLDGGGVAAGAGGGRCRAPAVADALAGMEGSGSGDVVVGSLVSVCSKRDGDWDRCLLKKARIEEAIDRVDRAIE